MQEPFLVIGLLLVAGFLANVIFSRTRVSQVLILMALGFVLGPALGVVDASAGSVLGGLTPFVGTLALIVLLFDGGITLNVFDLVRALPKATVFTVVVFLLSMVLTAWLSVAFLGWSALYGLLLGAAVGGTGSAIVLAMLEKSGAARESKSLLILESTITDAFSVVAAFVILQVRASKAGVDGYSVFNLLAGSFSIAILFGVLAALAWLTVLKRREKTEFPYMLTLAVVFILYALVEAAKGSGAVAVFLFGLVLSNAKRVAESLHLSLDFKLSPEVTSFQQEVTFFTRTFFFIFMGLILAPSGFSVKLIAFSLALVIVFYVVRVACQRIIVPDSPDKSLLATMMPRGLATAVLAGLPAAEGFSIPGFAEVALLVLVFTNLFATVGSVAYKPPVDGQVPPNPTVLKQAVPRVLLVKQPAEQKTKPR